MSAYYERSATTHLDGTPIFKSELDEENERVVAAACESAFRCSIRPFGRLAAIDFFAERDGRLVGVLELKSRPHTSTHYETVFLNVRKWLALLLASAGLGVPALFVVRFEDGIFWIPVAEVDGSGSRIGGCARTVKARSDVEPIIEVPIADMRRLA